MKPKDNAPEPAASRPHMPGYGIQEANAGAGLFEWSHVEQRMAASRNYWISTTRPDGRPHVTPVWGLWLEGAFYFSAGRQSRKARNLAANPAIAVHLESGDDVVIIEGAVEQVADQALLERYADAYNAKYAFRPDPDDPDGLAFAVRPRVAFAWLERDFPNTATRWIFD